MEADRLKTDRVNELDTGCECQDDFAANLTGHITGVFLDGKDKNTDPRLVSPLLLAYAGDSIFDLVVRTFLIKKGNRQVNKVNREACFYVSAPAQAKMADGIRKMLSEEERDIYRRGRNAKPNTKAKNASLEQYHKATGFEALMGYLYFKNDMKRLLELAYAGIKYLDKSE